MVTPSSKFLPDKVGLIVLILKRIPCGRWMRASVLQYNTKIIEKRTILLNKNILKNDEEKLVVLTEKNANISS